MIKNNFLSVLQFQLKLKIKSDNVHDYIIVDEYYKKQIERCINIIKDLNPDIVIFPEMSYQSEFDSFFKLLSKSGKLIVFGSTYFGSTNYTMIFQDGNLKQVIKRFPCGSESMIRFTEKISISDFLDTYLSEHEFYINGKKIYVLNCLEYYETAYFIARDAKLSSDLFGFVVPCSNSNPNVFIEETKALHNHNEYIYSFVCNRIKDEGKSGYGKSYIYGPIQRHEKDWLAQEGIMSETHNASILSLDSSTPSYAYGKFAFGKSLSRFGRSDLYINTPKDVIVKSLF